MVDSDAKIQTSIQTTVEQGKWSLQVWSAMLVAMPASVFIKKIVMQKSVEPTMYTKDSGTSTLWSLLACHKCKIVQSKEHNNESK